MLKELIKIENINLNLQATTKDEVIDEMALLLDKNGYIKNLKKFKKDVYVRESEGSTGIGFGVGIPHTKSKYVRECCIGVGISRNGVKYDSLDGEDVTLVFMLAIEGKETDLHLRALASLSRKLIHDEFRAKLLSAVDREEVYNLICD